MLTKILLTVGVIVLVVVAIRNAGNKRTTPRTTTDERPTPSPTRITAWVLIALIIALTVGLTIYQQWQQDDVVTIRVVNTATGETKTYRAYKDKTYLRRFRTVDGRTIIPAESDRVEVVNQP